MKTNANIPHPISLLMTALLMVILISWIGSIYEWQVQSLLSADGIRWMLRNVYPNVYKSPFLPLFILFIGIGVSIESGVFSAIHRRMKRLNHSKPLSPKQRRALLLALLSAICYLLLVGIATFSPLAILLGITGTLSRSPFIEGIVPLTSLLFCIIGVVYGITAGRFQTESDIIHGMATLPIQEASYFVYLLLASQLIGIIHYSQLYTFCGIDENKQQIMEMGIYYLPLVVRLIHSTLSNK